MTISISKLKDQFDKIISAVTRTTPSVESDLHFGSNYTPVRFHIKANISNDCNAIVLTRFCRVSETHEHTPA